jgi:hypothetical protein
VDPSDILSLFEGRCGHRWLGATGGAVRPSKLARSPEIAGYFRELMLRWLRIAERAQGDG